MRQSQTPWQWTMERHKAHRDHRSFTCSISQSSSKGEDGICYGYVVSGAGGRNRSVRAERHWTVDQLSTMRRQLGVVEGFKLLVQWQMTTTTLRSAWTTRRPSEASGAKQRFPRDVRSKLSTWCPGHRGIDGSELVDKLAKTGQTADTGPDYGPTIAGIRSQARRLLRVARERHWDETKDGLSSRYKAWHLDYDFRVPRGARPTQADVKLQVYLAIRTEHGDFVWYHRKYDHDEAEFNCSARRRIKTPEHLVICSKTAGRSTFDDWP